MCILLRTGMYFESICKMLVHTVSYLIYEQRNSETLFNEYLIDRESRELRLFKVILAKVDDSLPVWGNYYLRYSTSVRYIGIVSIQTMCIHTYMCLITVIK